MSVSGSVAPRGNMSTENAEEQLSAAYVRAIAAAAALLVGFLVALTACVPSSASTDLVFDMDQPLACPATEVVSAALGAQVSPLDELHSASFNLCLYDGAGMPEPHEVAAAQVARGRLNLLAWSAVGLEEDIASGLAQEGPDALGGTAATVGLYLPENYARAWLDDEDRGVRIELSVGFGASEDPDGSDLVAALTAVWQGLQAGVG